MSVVVSSLHSAAVLDKRALAAALSLRDLTDSAEGAHALQLVVEAVTRALATRWNAEVVVHRGSPLVTVADNYDRLQYPSDAVARDGRYTRYAGDGIVLRTQTSALVPGGLERVAKRAASDTLLVCPGLVYRRDSIDRMHVGEPHQLDLWRVRRGRRLGAEDLREMIASVVAAALPGREHRVTEAVHPYTQHGLQIDVREGTTWVEIGECGLAHPAVLAGTGHDAETSGLAMGLGLDRIVMLAKGLDDIRLLRAADPRIAAQMADLSPYRRVSSMPPIRRDLSIATSSDTSPEALGDRVRAALGERAAAIESIDVVSETESAALPKVAIERLGLSPGQRNVLVRVVLRDLERTMTHEEANELRDAIYESLHEGTRWEWAGLRRHEG